MMVTLRNSHARPKNTRDLAKAESNQKLLITDSELKMTLAWYLVVEFSCVRIFKEFGAGEQNMEDKQAV